MLEKKINDKKAIIGVVGLGYIGLSLLQAFGDDGFELVGYELNEKKVDMLKRGESYLNFLPFKTFLTWIERQQFTPSTDSSILEKADVIILSVHTSLDIHGVPDFSYLRKAFLTVQHHARKGQLIILQSTTYPGCTEEELLPLLQHLGKVGEDYYLGYVPEISDIGNPEHAFNRLPRMVSGVTFACQSHIERLYRMIGCETVRCSSPKVAEAAKIMQNTYRLLNISLVNEMKIMFDRMGIDIWDVIAAASNKPFGFTPFYPSPGIGGDCIPVDPFYLTWKAVATDGPTTLIRAAEIANKMTPYYVIEKIIFGLGRQQKALNGAKILLLGVTYKKDMDDLRQSAGLKILSLLKERRADVSYHDPFVKALPPLPAFPILANFTSIDLDYAQLNAFDAIVIATNHSMYDWVEIVKNGQLLIDTHHVLASIPGADGKVISA